MPQINVDVTLVTPVFIFQHFSWCVSVVCLGQTYHHGLPPTSHSSYLSFIISCPHFPAVLLYYGVTTNLLVASCGICGITNSKEQIAKRSVFIFHHFVANGVCLHKLCAALRNIVATIMGIIPLPLLLLLFVCTYFSPRWDFTMIFGCLST